MKQITSLLCLLVAGSLSTAVQAFSGGTGTKDSPYVISTVSDWNELSQLKSTEGVYFALGSSIGMEPSMISTEFNGHLDGKGDTIHIGYNAGASLFNQIGAQGTVENLTVECDIFNTKGTWSSLLAIYNYGTVENCNFSVHLLNLKETSKFGGGVVKNSGLIRNCTAYIYMPLSSTYSNTFVGFANMASVGGICWYNYNTIDHCSFRGSLESNNNSDLGGIAAINYYDDKQRGNITNCINHGELKITKVNSSSNAISVGGIAACNYGSIKYCANDGTITAYCTSSDCNAGGILGSSSSKSSMSYCINRGSMKLNTTNSGSGCAGIIGFSDRSSMSHCISTGTITIIGTIKTCFHAVAGTHRNDTIKDCYYSGTVKDSYATRLTYAISWADVIYNMNHAAGFKCMVLDDGLPALAWEKGYTVLEPSEPDSIPANYANVIYIEPLNALPGDTLTLSVKMKNEIGASGFQTDVYLPDGITFLTDQDGFPLADLSTARTTSKKTDYFNAAVQADGALRLLCASTRQYLFSGNDGEVATITVHIADGIKAGAYPVLLKNMELSDARATAYRQPEFKVTLTVAESLKGDVNNDRRVDFDDACSLVRTYVNGNADSLDPQIADVDENGVINASDAVDIIEQYLKSK